MAERLLALAEASGSLNLMTKIAGEMSGRTFHLHTHLLYDLRTLLGSEPKTYVEIGTFFGGSLSLILQHPFPTECHCVDPLNVVHDQRAGVESNIGKYSRAPERVHLHQEYSNDPRLLSQLSGLTIDLLFIDGSHTYHAVMEDFRNYEPLVSPNGFIVFDDYHDDGFPEVRRAVDEIVAALPAGKFEVIGDLPNRLKAPPTEFPRTNNFILRKLPNPL